MPKEHSERKKSYVGWLVKDWNKDIKSEADHGLPMIRFMLTLWSKQKCITKKGWAKKVRITIEEI